MPKYCVLLPGQHTPAMYQEYAGKLHQAQAHCPRWLHLRWSRVLDIAGKTMLELHPKTSDFMGVVAGWDLFFRGFCHNIRGV